MLRYSDEVYSEWVAGVDEVARTNLEKPLLLRETESLQIAVNFDSEVRFDPLKQCYMYIYLSCG